jgi:hypothetical protein
MTSGVLRHFNWTAAILAGALALATIATAQSTESAAPSLQGTWRVQVTLYNCTNPSMTLPPFWSLLSFHRGGTESETTSNPALLPGQRTSGYGFWKALGNNNYVMVSEAFILFDTPTTPPPFQTGTQKIFQTITLTDQDHFISDGKVSFFATDGTNYRNGCAKSDGVRLTASPDQP